MLSFVLQLSSFSVLLQCLICLPCIPHLVSFSPFFPSQSCIFLKTLMFFPPIVLAIGCRSQTTLMRSGGRWVSWCVCASVHVCVHVHTLAAASLCHFGCPKRCVNAHLLCTCANSSLQIKPLVRNTCSIFHKHAGSHFLK